MKNRSKSLRDKPKKAGGKSTNKKATMPQSAAPLERVSAPVKAPAPAATPAPRPQLKTAASPAKDIAKPAPKPVVKTAAAPAKEMAKEAKDIAKEAKIVAKEVTKDIAKEAKFVAKEAKGVAKDMAKRTEKLTNGVTESLETSFEVAGQVALAVNCKLLEFAQQNVTSGLELVRSLAGARSPAEMLQLQVSYWQERMGAFASQAQELRALSADLVAKTAEPIRRQVKRSLTDKGA